MGWFMINIIKKIYSYYFHKSLIIKKQKIKNKFSLFHIHKNGIGSGTAVRRESRNKQTNRNERKSIND